MTPGGGEALGGRRCASPAYGGSQWRLCRAPGQRGAGAAYCRGLPDLPIQVGGGIRDAETVEAYLEAGVQWCILGTKAVREPHFSEDLPAVSRTHHRLDAKTAGCCRGLVETVTPRRDRHGATFEHDGGVDAIVYTDISRDGMMNGV